MKKIWVLVLLLGGVGWAVMKKRSISSFSVQAPIRLAVWTHYLPPELLEIFERKTGIRVELSYFSSNEELLAKIQAGGAAYDVIFPSDYMVSVMKKLGLLASLNQAQLSHWKEIDPRVLGKKYDPENQFSIPYSWGTTGIAFRSDLIPPGAQVGSWKELLTDPLWFGKVTFLDDAREVLGAALKVLGLNPNTTARGDLEKAKAFLVPHKKAIRAFLSELRGPLIQGEVVVAQAFSIDAIQAHQATQGRVQFVFPSEGGTLWIDHLAILKTSSRVAEAHQLINFLLDRENSMKVTQKLLLAPANREVFSLLPATLRDNPALFPADEVLNRCQMIEDIGASILEWDRIWTELKLEQAAS